MRYERAHLQRVEECRGSDDIQGLNKGWVDETMVGGEGGASENIKS